MLETPLQPSRLLSDAARAAVYLKLENLQPTGSFKVRGALHKLLSLGDAQRRRGIVAASTGNHGAAIAYGASALAIRAIVFVPEAASPAKVENIRALGAEVRAYGDESAATETHARAYAAEHGMTYVSPYNDWDVVAGQSTIGLEIYRQLPFVDVLIASLGGGGMIGGAAGFLKSVRPGVRVIAASARNSKTMMESVKAGRIVQTEHLPTLSDGTAGGVEEGAITFDLCRSFVDEYVDVSEDDIKQAIRYFIETHHILIEGAAGVAVAALRNAGERFAGLHVAVVICGANISATSLRDAL